MDRGWRLLNLQIRTGTADIWVLDPNTGNGTRLASQGTSTAPVWSPDGKCIFFGGGPVGAQLLSIAADGSGGVEPIALANEEVDPLSVSSDGKWLAYSQTIGGRRNQIWIRPVSGPGNQNHLPRPCLTSSTRRSPRTVTGSCTRPMSQAQERFTSRHFRPVKKKVSIAGGVNPAWSRNGKEIFYVGQMTASGKKSMIAADFTPAGTFKTSPPHALFEAPWLVLTAPSRSYDPTPDGQHFIAVVRKENPPAQPVFKLNVVLNWFEELKRRAPRSQ
jgi:eukaryotic-like serine/threonine-protein kinase